jgi:hypothetical protein
MVTKTLDGKEIKWLCRDHKRSDYVRSINHIQVRNIIKEVHPTVTLLEEVPIKVLSYHTLYLDFYIPLYKKAIEIHGEQHYRYIPHFHSNKLSFLKQQKNDRQKVEWCEINNIEIVILSHKDNIDEWKRAIGR